MTDTTVGTVSVDLDGTLAVGPLNAVLREVTLAVADGDAARADMLREAVFARHRALLRGRDPAAYDWCHIASDVFGDGHEAFAHDIVRRCRIAAEAGGSRLVNGTTVQALQRLRQASWRLVVATNGRADVQVPVLDSLGVRGLFDAVVTSDRAGTIKPDPAFFRDVHAGRGPWFHVGDRLGHDVVGSVAAGARPVLLRPDAPWVGRADTLAAGRPPVPSTVVAAFCARLRHIEDPGDRWHATRGPVADAACTALAAAWVARDFDDVVARVLTSQP